MHKQRYLGKDPLAMELYEIMSSFPILSPHGHVSSEMLAANQPFTNAVDLLITPDHYVTRMLHSHGITYDQLGIPKITGTTSPVSAREVWAIFAANWHLFLGTPSRVWISETFTEIFGISEELTPDRADYFFDAIGEKLDQPEFLPLALFRKFNIEVLATTDATSDSLESHKKLATLDFGGKVLPTFRPDDVSDPSRPDWKAKIAQLATVSGIATDTFDGLLSALRKQRAFFKEMGATATDHGVFSPQTIALSASESEVLFKSLMSGNASAEDSAKFTAVMLLEHAKMAADDGLVMQLHPGSLRNYDYEIAKNYGTDRGMDIPVATTYTRELRDLLNAVGKHPNFRMVLFTLDESTYSRELAPLAGVYPSLRLGPPWWFHDSLNGMQRWRDSVTETAGYYNTVGFIDDTRAFTSIPVRHDVARRFDSAYLAAQVSQDRLSKSAAIELAPQIAYHLSKDFFKL